MTQFVGTCVGGPQDGMRMAHWSKTKKFYRPMLHLSSMAQTSANERVEAVEIGEYRLNDFQQWHWWETQQGKAMDILFGAVQ